MAAVVVGWMPFLLPFVLPKNRPIFQNIDFLAILRLFWPNR
jgi:hypothetical protein